MIRQPLEGGARLARASIAGNAVATVLWSTAAAAGLVAIVLGTLRSTRGAHDAPSECPDPRRMGGWWSAYAVGRGQAFVAKPLARRRLNIVTGAVLPALGVAVAGGV